MLAQGSAGGNALRVDLVDSAGKVIASSARGDALQAVRRLLDASPRTTAATSFDFTAIRSMQRGVGRDDEWRPLARRRAHERSRRDRAYYDRALGACSAVVGVMLA